ncbi:MAG: c-type cytochrome [Acidobacteriia bacterium]|nr:c-type cytochrome [Terriglobia bacterium]
MMHPIRRLALIALILGARLGAQPAADKQPLAEQVFTNVQVLKGIPVSEFMGTMGFFSASLGLNCVFCHVPESLQDWKKFAEDVPRKRIARNMLAMVNTINKNNFGGRAVVTCYSCHHGNERPKSVPSLALQYGTPEEDPNEVEVPPQAVAGPSADQLLEKFVAASGGTRANHTSYSIRGTYEGYETYHQQVPFELWVKAPAQMATVVHTQNGASTTVYDGNQGWVASPNNPVMLLPMASGAESDGARLDAQLFFPSGIRQAPSQWRTGFPQTDVGDKDVQVMEGAGPARTRFKLYFDLETGLLLRQVRYVSTVVGTNPYQVDYADYRDVGGVKLPYQWTVTWTNGQSIWKVTEIQADAAVPAGRFAKPAPAVLTPAGNQAH